MRPAIARDAAPIAVEAGAVHGAALCRMFNRATGCESVPTYLSADHEPLYRFHQACAAPADTEPGPGQRSGESPGLSVVDALSWAVSHAWGRVTQAIGIALSR